MPNRKSEIRGCIDLGSSYFRLLVARMRGRPLPPVRALSKGRAHYRSDPGSGSRDIEIFSDEKVYVGWGGALARGGRLLPEEMERAEAALKELVFRAKNAGCPDPSIVGTGTMRRALNGREALEKLEAAVSPRITVLSQRGEAALGFIGASSAVAADAPVLQIDVGGTSTEIVRGERGTVRDYAGLAWGTHTVDALIPRTGPHRALTLLRSRVFEGAWAQTPPAHYPLPGASAEDTILCTGGTAVSLAVVLNYTRRIHPLFREGELVSVDDLERLLRRLWRLSVDGRLDRLPLEPERASLLIPGMLLLVLLVREMRIPAFSVTTRDLRWGGIIVGEKLDEYSTDGRGDG